MRILIIEDDPELHEFLKLSFSAHATAVDSALDGQKGSFLARTNHYDCIVLDITLPKKTGLEVCKEVREVGVHTPIIILSAINKTYTKVNLLEAGADDYLSKPFSFDELFARIHAIARRPKNIVSDTITSGDISINLAQQSVMRNGKNIYLTKKEFSLLEYLMRNKGIVLSRGMIMEHVWNIESDPFSNTIEAHILNLRKKINVGSKKNIIINIPGRGYMIEDRTPSESEDKTTDKIDSDSTKKVSNKHKAKKKIEKSPSPKARVHIHAKHQIKTLSKNS